MTFLDNLLFSQPDSSLGKAATYGALAALFGVGVVHWIVFFDYGEMSFRGGDWPKEYLYYSVLQEALQTGTIPYHVDGVIQGTQRFLAIHETVISPQVVLLRFMSIGNFVVANTLVMYTVGFWGCLVLRRRYALSLFSFTVLYLLFHFNGYITAHLAAGHSMWNGYFLMPFYCYYVLKLCDTIGSDARIDYRIPLKLALTLFAMNLQGSFRMYVWHVLFLGLVAAFNWKYLRSLAVAVVFSGLLSCFIILADMITYLNGRHIFLTGYPTVSVLLESFVFIKRFDIGPPPAIMVEVFWWEYDIFTGAIGLAAVIYLGVCLRCRTPKALDGSLEGTEYRQLDWPMGVMSVFSMAAFYAIIATLMLPFLNSEGTPSRFLITPFLFLLIISCIRLDRVLGALRQNGVSLRSPVKWLMMAGVIQTGFELATHSKAWAVDKWDRSYPEANVDVAFNIVHQVDPVYEWSLRAALSLSALTLILWTYRYLVPSVAPRSKFES